VGIILFVATAGLCIAILWPQKGWTFSVSAKLLAEDFVDVPERNTPEQVQRFLAERFETYTDRNQERLEVLFGLFSAACVSLTLDVAAWLIALVG
jgi:hypothetical protein